MPKLELTINLTLSHREAKALHHMLGNQTISDREKLGLDRAKSNMMSDIYSLLDAVISDDGEQQ